MMRFPRESWACWCKIDGVTNQTPATILNSTLVYDIILIPLVFSCRLLCRCGRRSVASCGRRELSDVHKWKPWDHIATFIVVTQVSLRKSTELCSLYVMETSATSSRGYMLHFTPRHVACIVRGSDFYRTTISPDIDISHHITSHHILFAQK